VAGKLPKLRLVGQAVAKDSNVVSNVETPAGQVSSGRAPLEHGVVIAVNQLNQQQRQRIAEITALVDVKATVLGSLLSIRSWDLRPILMAQSENSPSVVRLLGPEVTLSVGISNRVQDYLNRLTEHPELSTKLLDWGVHEGQIWCRREFVEKTLRDVALNGAGINLSDVLVIAKKALLELQRWHKVGLIHGHIAASNVHIDSKGNISLLDSTLGLALVHANKSLGAKDMLPGYNIESFAPEALVGEAVLVSSDIYSLGKTLQELFRLTPEGQNFYKLSEGKSATVANPVIAAIMAMSSADIRKRPTIDSLLELLNSHLPSYKVKSSKQEFAHTSSPTPDVADVASPAASFAAQPVAMSPMASAMKSYNAGDFVQSDAVAKRTISPKPSAFGIPETIDVVVPKQKVQESNKTPTRSLSRNHLESQLDYEAEASFFDEEEDNSISIADLQLPLEHLVAKPKSSGGFKFFALLICLLAVVAVAYQFYSDPEPQGGPLSNEQLLLAWRSGVPSRVIAVFDAALGQEKTSQYALQLIEDSALKGENSLKQVNGRLLQIVYDPRWEIELSQEDRRSAIALAAGALLKNRLPTNLLPLNQLHPGVLLAIIATANDRANRVLQDIPASSLSALPAPIGLAFAELENSIPNITAAHPSVVSLARFAAGVKDRDDIVEFIEDHHSVALRCLSTLFSNDEAQLRNILETVLLHPSIKAESSAAKWAAKIDLLGQRPGTEHWREVSTATKLRLMAGVVPGERLSTDVVIELLTHPDPKIRSYAINELLNRVTFQHPSALLVLRNLAANPEKLDVQQTTGLVLLMINPNESKSTRVKEWLGQNPPQEVLEQILVSGAVGDSENKLDFYIARELKDRNWQPSIDVLRNLIKHPHKYVRLFAYDQAVNLSDDSKAEELLSIAIANEKDPVLLKRAKAMLEVLKAA